ncbi:hypothetical protein MFRU_010g02690 [Monilinia fructicola]|nr:hypothetical protein MFRU_010g02690 [Monilinia fructicola]
MPYQIIERCKVPNHKAPTLSRQVVKHIPPICTNTSPKLPCHNSPALPTDAAQTGPPTGPVTWNHRIASPARRRTVPQRESVERIASCIASDNREG